MKTLLKIWKGLKKKDINRDAYYDKDRIMLRRLKRFPWEFVDDKTPVCYVFTPSFKDEQYEYKLYVKFFVRGNEVNVMSLHWGDFCNKAMPEKVYNYRTKEFDSIEKVNEFLEEKLNYYERER